jgi:hypothetical protein
MVVIIHRGVKNVCHGERVKGCSIRFFSSLPGKKIGDKGTLVLFLSPPLYRKPYVLQAA